jgi:hypothetical protein
MHVEVCAAILSFLNMGNMDPCINTTHIALIPKVATLGCVTDFRPISLCNIIYKLISKVLANRLKVVLLDIISCFQSAFIPGRMINDNILAAYETMHSMQTRMWSKVGFMGLKIDMSKAYDRVEWEFLEASMLRMGFDDRWVHLIMTCVRSVSYLVVVNGNPVGPFSPSRGIKHGDPISPYLFLLCAEVLSSLLLKAEKREVNTGVPTSPKGPRLNHLFFADDSLLFCKANSVEWRGLLKILGVYEAGSGQKLNLSKTSIFFSRNTPMERKQEILLLSGLSEATRIDSYLSLPTIIGKSRCLAFQDIVERVSKRLSNWKVKFLSQAGKEVLLKAVVQAIPTYSMGVFQLPIALCKELNKLMQNFWWTQMANRSQIHWMSWENIWRSKSIGGFGFRDLTLFNKALLAKQGWRLIQDPNSMVGKILQAKYFPNFTFLKANLGSKPSYVWRSLFNSRELLVHEMIWRVGDGKSIQVWGDRWLPRPTSYAIQSIPNTISTNAKVADLIDEELKGWNLSLVNEVFDEDEAKAISQIPLSPGLLKDRLIWMGTKNEEFTVRSAYHLSKELKAREKWAMLDWVKRRGDLEVFMGFGGPQYS